jgi:hypothetical protein
MGSKSSNEKVYEFKNPTTFVKPDLCEEVPILEKYCRGPSVFNDYHCQNLQRILFSAANSERQGDKIFDFITSGTVSKDTEKLYYINSLMENREDPATIYNTVKAFNEKCHELETKHNKTCNARASVSTKENETTA